jgi:small conductance mechanosensitive channel
MDAEKVVSVATEMVTTWGLRLVGALALLLIGMAVARALRAAARRALQKAGTDPTLVPFVTTLVYYIVVIFVGVAVLGVFGIQTASIIAILGAAGLAVGLALQGTLSNFAAGVMLLVFRPFRVGQYVEAGGAAGTVESIGLFATTLDTPDNVRVIVPNGAVYGGNVLNYSANEHRRIDLVVGIAYADDIGRAVEAIQIVLAADGRVLKEPAPTVAVSELGESSVNLVVRPWCRGSDYWPLRFDLLRRLKEQIEAAGCSIPFPQRDVHVLESPAAR